MKLVYVLPAILAACATPCPQDQIVCDPATKTCICERPTATLSVIDKRGDRATPKAPERPVTRDPVDDSGMFDGKEPARGDYDNERDYRDAHDSWKEGRG